jgi:hypothetical protein
MYTIKTEKLREFIEHKKEEWTVFASGSTKDGGSKDISFNLEQNKVRIGVYVYGGNEFLGEDLKFEFIRHKTHENDFYKTFDSITEAVEYFNNTLIMRSGENGY